MAPTLEDYEYVFDEDGFILNASNAGVAASLPFVDILKVSGLDSPEFRTSTRDHEGVDGGYIDSEYMRMRTIILEGTLYADVNDPDTVCDQLRYDFRPTESERPFYFKHPGKPARVVYGKGQGARYDVDQLRHTGLTPVQLTIICGVPYIYAVEETAAFGSLGAADSGHGFDHGFDHGFGGAIVSSGAAVIFNGGNHRAYPMVTINGPISNPTLLESRTGRELEFTLDLAKDEFLVIDLRRKRVHLNGTVNRRNAMTSGPRSWWWIDPGTSTITLGGSAGGGSGTVTATAVSATGDYIRVADADIVDIEIGDRCHLYDSLGALLSTDVLTVTGIVSAGGGSTDVFFTPTLGTVPTTGDILRAGAATFTVTLQDTYY